MKQHLFLAYSDYLKEKYGEKVYKLPVNLPLTCPNRKNGRGGCTFCAEAGTGFEARPATESVTQQLWNNRKHIEQKYKAKKYIAYFQNYTNTYMPEAEFEEAMREAAAFPDVVEIAVSTRPDCINECYLDILSKIKKERQIEITIELGLQTVNYHTLDRINRGHSFGAFLESVLMIQRYSFDICVHMIFNLPGDTMRDIMEAADIINALPITSVKIHSLYIAENTALSSDYKNGKITLCSKEEYLERLIYFIGHARQDLVIERLFSRIPAADSVFCNWGCSWWVLMDELKEKLRERQIWQGKYYTRACDRALNER